MDILDLILSYVTTYLPVITSVVVMICTAVTTIKRVCHSTNEELDALKAENKELRHSNAELRAEMRENTKAIQDLVRSNNKIRGE